MLRENALDVEVPHVHSLEGIIAYDGVICHRPATASTALGLAHRTSTCRNRHGRSRVRGCGGTVAEYLQRTFEAGQLLEVGGTGLASQSMEAARLMREGRCDAFMQPEWFAQDLLISERARRHCGVGRPTSLPDPNARSHLHQHPVTPPPSPARARVQPTSRATCASSTHRSRISPGDGSARAGASASWRWQTRALRARTPSQAGACT